MEGDTSLWVFGYGSLCWHPGFAFKASKIGHVQGYLRRFWQGNTTHRGVPGKPGRVATLVKNDNGKTYGVAYQIEGEAALSYLKNREVQLGGYTTDFVLFQPREGASFPVLLYVATPSSSEWSGPAPLHEIASQIVTCSGPTGHNVEYLLRLAEFMREFIPEEHDDHLLKLESLVRLRVKENNLCLSTLMGEKPKSPSTWLDVDNNLENNNEVPERRDTFQFTAKVPSKKLRCLNL